MKDRTLEKLTPARRARLANCILAVARRTPFSAIGAVSSIYQRIIAGYETSDDLQVLRLCRFLPYAYPEHLGRRACLVRALETIGAGKLDNRSTADAEDAIRRILEPKPSIG